MWGVGTVLGDGAPPPQVTHGPHDVAVNLLRYLGRGATLVSGPAGHPVLLAFMDRRLFAVLVFTLRDSVILEIEGPWTPPLRSRDKRTGNPPRHRTEGSPTWGARAAFLFGCVAG